MTSAGRNAGARGRFHGKVAAVTGGASGIGLCIVQRYAAEGGRVVVGDVDLAPALETASRLGPESIALEQCDVTVESDHRALIRTALDRFGRVDHAVVCAGRADAAAIVNTDLADFCRTVDVCLTGTFLAIKHAARVMQAGGAIVTIASINARMAMLGGAAYNSAKAGVVQLTATAAVELAHRQIRANAVLPGHIMTPMGYRSGRDPDMLREWRDNQPLGRSGEAEDVAALVLWLCSDESSYVTAESITVDGGTHTQRFPRFLEVRGVPIDPLPEPASPPRFPSSE